MNMCLPQVLKIEFTEGYNNKSGNYYFIDFFIPYPTFIPNKIRLNNLLDSIYKFHLLTYLQILVTISWYLRKLPLFTMNIDCDISAGLFLLKNTEILINHSP